MGTQTYTVAQALQSTASGLTVVDLAANLATVAGNSALIARVSAFTLAGNDSIDATRAGSLSTLGGKFSRGSYTLLIRDTVASLTNPANASGLTLGSSIQVLDTAANILAAASNPVIHGAGAISLTGNSTVTLAQLLLLESWPSFITGSTTITLADSAANLLALTAAQTRSALHIYNVAISSTVSATNAWTLLALPGFSIASGATLTIADSVANVHGLVASYGTLATTQGVLLAVSDSVSNLVGSAAILASLAGSFSSMTVTLAASGTLTASQLAILQGVAHFSPGSGHTLTLADTVQNLLALSSGQLALVQACALASSAAATVAQVQQLVALPGFSAGAGHQLTAIDTLADLAALTAMQKALLSGITADDTVAHLVAAGSAALTGLTAVRAELDAASYTIAQLAALADFASHGTLTLVPTTAATSLHVVDTFQNIGAGSATLTALENAGMVTATASNDYQILSASAAAAMVASPGFDPSAYTLAVSDTGAAIAAVATSIFQHGFQSITVTGGVLAGTLADLLDPTLHFAASGSGTAQLSGDATVTAAQLAELAMLPNFGVADGTTVTVRDTVAALAASQSIVVPYAGIVQVADTASVTAAVAAQLAAERSAVGAGHFSFGGNFLLVTDTAANLIDPANAGGLALADAIVLSSDSRVSASGAMQLAALGMAFAPGDATVIISDTAANLASLASDPITLDMLNSWGSLALLSADATLSIADATPLTGFTGFIAGSHHLIISDTATNLLLTANAPVVALASAVQLAAADTVTVADAAALIALHGFSTGGMTLTVADTPAHLAAMASAITALAAGETLVAPTVDNAAGFVLTAAQLAALLALPNLDATGFSGQITLADTATTLLADAAVLAELPTALLGHVIPALSADATLSVSQAEALHALSGVTLNGHALTISDTVLNIAGLDAGTRAMATDIQAIGGGNGSYSASEFITLSQTSNFASSGQLPVADTAVALQALVPLSLSALLHISGVSVTAGDPVSAAQAQALSTLPNLQAGNAVTIVDTMANLLQVTGGGSQPDDWAGEQLASRVTLSADATITAAQALQLAGLGYRFDNGGFALTVQDTPTALLAVVSGLGPIVGQIGATLLAPNGTPWVVSAATAAQLALLPNFGPGPAGGIIADSVANLLAPANAALIAAAPSVTLNGNATATVADAQALHALSNFSLGTHGTGVANQLTILDGAGHLATLDSATAAMASAIQLQGNGIVSVAQFQAIGALPNYSNSGKLLLVSDTATNLLTLSGGNVGLASAIMLSSNVTLSAAQAEQLTALSGFTTGIARIGVLDTAAHLLQVTGAGPMPDDWNGELAASTVTLSQDATLSASQAAELALLGSRFSVGSHLLTVSDSAAALIASANAPGLALAGAITLAGPETLSAANATALAAVSGLSKSGNTVTVTDTAANLAFAGYAAGLALADSVQLGSATSLTAAAAETLIGMANYAANGAAPLTIVDTLPNLLGLATATLANNTALLQGTPVALAGDTVATVAQMTALATLPQYALFSRNGHTLTIADSGRHLATYTPDSIAVPTAYRMTGDATLTAAQADVLAARSVNLDDNTLTISDTPAALLSTSHAAGLSLATALVLSANATVDAATAAALAELTQFSTGGHLLTVSDTAPALLALAGGTQQMVSALTLSDAEVVDVATLLGLTLFGIKFSTAGHALAVADTAAHLATLNALETALTGAQVLSADATVSAAVAAQLAALPGFAVGSGVALIVQDSVANLLALSSAVRAIATGEQLAAGANVTVTAADAAALAALPHFSTTGATITVDDTIAALNNAANAGWHGVFSQYVVTDSVSNLVANANTALLTGAAVVNLLGDTQVDAATLATLAGIPGFAPGSAVLTVVDGPAEIAANATAIAAFATGARVDASTPVSAADAELLAELDSSGKLSFVAGVHLAVQDSDAALSAAANADGLALAGSITVLDSVAQLVAAAAQNWGSHSPFYVLDADGVVTGVQAAALAALGSHFSMNGFTLAMADDAGGASGNAAALAALGLGVQVTDSIAHVDANAAGLIALGGALQAVNLTDISPVTAAAAAELHGLAAKLGGQPVLVADTAGAVDTNLADLRTLGLHLAAVQVTDTAAHVAAAAADLSALGGILTVSLTDAAPIAATDAAGLVPILPNLAAGTMVDVSDTGATLAAQEQALHQLDAVIGTITLSDGTTISAATAASLAPLDSHFGLGVQLLVHGTVAAIVAATAELTALQADSRLAGVVAVNETAEHVVAESAALAGLGAQATILDSAAAVSANLDALQAFLDAGGGLGTITLTDGGSPSIALSVAQITADAGVLAHLAYPLAVHDTAAALQTDLLSGSSVMLAELAQIGAIVASDGGTLSLTAAQFLAPQIDDGTGSALAKFSGGTVAVTDAAVADLANIAAAGVAPASVAVIDTTATIRADLTSGSPQLVAQHDLVTTITADGGSISLTEDQARATFVDDGAGSVFARLNGSASLEVTDVLAADATVVATLPVPPAGIVIVDTAAAIQADLVSGSSALLAQYALITGITVSDGNPITLTEAQATAAHVDDDAASLFARMPGAQFDVTGVTVAQIAAVNNLYVTPAHIAIADGAAQIQADLAFGSSALLANLAMITGIVGDGGVVTLTEAQARAAGVDDGAGSVFAEFSGGTLAVTDVAAADIGLVLGLGFPPASITLSDTAQHLHDDLVSGSSEILANLAAISAITASDGTLTLTAAEITAAGIDDGPASALAKLSATTLAVTGASIAQIDGLVALGVPPAAVAIADSSAHLQADLADAHPVTLAHPGLLSAISLTDGGTPTLTLDTAELTRGDSVLTLIDTPYQLAIGDTAANLQAELLLPDSPLLSHLAAITGITATDSGSITMSADQVTRANIDDGAGSVLGKMTGETLVVSDVRAADVATILALPVVPSYITVVDTASGIAADLASGASQLVADRAAISSITIGDGGTVHLTEAQVVAAGVDDGAGSVLSLAIGLILDVTDVATAEIATVVALPIAPASIDVSDTAAAIEADLASGSSAILAQLALIGGIAVTDSGTITLTASQATAAGVDDGTGSAFAKMTGGTLAVTGVDLTQLDAAANLQVPPVSIQMSDTAAHIQGDLTGGASAILAHLALIGGIVVSDAGSISLTETQVLAAQVDDGAGSVFALIGGGSLTVTGVPAADVATIAGLPVAPAHILVADSAADIAADLASAGSLLVANLATIDTIAVNDLGSVTLTAAQIQAAGVDAALAKLTGTVIATDVTVAEIGTVLGLGVPPTSIAVADSAGNIEADLISGSSVILANLAQISGITAPSGSITLTVAEVTAAGVDDGAGSAMAKLSGTTLAISDAAVADLPTLAALQVVPDAIAISDTAANIQTDLDSGTPAILSVLSGISGITVSDHGTIQLTQAQVLVAGVDDGAGSALALTSGGSLAVTGVDLASLDTIATLGVPPSAIAVSDTAANIQGDLVAGVSQLAAHGALLSDVHVNDGGTITLTGAEILAAGVDDGASAALAHLSGGSLVVTGGTVADLAELTALQSVPNQIGIGDSAAHVQADLISGGSVLLAHVGVLGGIVLTDAGTIVLTETQVQGAGVDDGPGCVLSHVSGGLLQITEVPVGDIATMVALTVPPDSIVVLDSAAAIAADLGGAAVIAGNAGVIASVAVTDASLDATTAATLYDGLQTATVSFDESGLTISDTAAALLGVEATHAAMLAAAQAVTLGADATGLTAAQAASLATLLGGQLNGHSVTVVDNATNLLDAANAGGIALASAVALDAPLSTSAHNATLLAGLHAFNAGAQPITVQDTPANLLDAANAAGIAIATTVTPDADCSVSAATLAQLGAIAGFADGGHQITLQDTAATVVALDPAVFASVYQTDVADSAANVTANLDALQTALTAHGHALVISVSGAVPNTPVITVDTATYSADRLTIDAVDTAGIIRVTGSAADLSALAATLHSDAAVGEVDVIDSATNILTDLPALNTIGTKFSAATVSDATVTAAMVAGLLSIPHLQAGALVIADSGAQIAAAIAANGPAGITFLNSQTVQLNQDSVVTAGDALALESLTSLSKAGHQLSVWDTATHLTDSIDGYLAAVKAGIIDHVYLRTIAGSVTITASTASSLFSIAGFSKNNPDSSANVLTAQDTAAHIDSAYTALNLHRAMLSNVVVSGTTTVTDATFGHLLTLGATTGLGVNVTVRDSAANIIAGAPAQISGTPSITPAAWLLSGSATVSEAGIAFLGGLSGFSAGAYALTLAADATVSVADANAIGTLGAAFRLGAHHLYVPGTVADLSGLNPAAQSIVLPQIADSFSNIAGMPGSSGLLGGTIVVNDSEAVSVAQASAFLGLLKVGGGPGIPAANVSFAGHVEAVTDTLANIQTLTGAAAWTQNASVQGDFSLVVADSVAHLIDPANTAALATMAGTTLAGDQTTTAADAESLFAVQTGIHFSLGSHTLTVQDSAANLLDPVNIDGVGMASVLLLAGPDTVTAADAETLLAAANFQLDTTLTVSDSSDALLDGTLATAINASAYHASVQVELSGAETLDAQTAHRLVNLPGYTDNGDLSIQDSASYLLNAANHDAEAAASSVILAGDETVSAATAVGLAAVPHFALGGFTLHLASNDYANAATLQTIADFGAGFDANGHSLTMTQDAIALTPDEYAALQADGLVGNGHALSALPVALTVTATGGSISVDGTGVDTATVTLYDASGSVLTTTSAAPGFTVSAADAGVNMALTETVGANPATSESAPVVLLEQALLEGIVTSDSASFAGSGAVHVAGSEYLDLYSLAAAPAHPGSPVLVYDAGLHTLSLDVDGHAPVVLVTLGGATTAAQLDASEILVKHQA